MKTFFAECGVARMNTLGFLAFHGRMCLNVLVDIVFLEFKSIQVVEVSDEFAKIERGCTVFAIFFDACETSCVQLFGAQHSEMHAETDFVVVHLHH